MKKLALLCFFGLPFILHGQDIHFQLRDSLTQETIPFATVLSNFGESTISNEEGNFRLTKSEAFVPTDSLFISCMGFKDLALGVDKSKFAPLPPLKEIELNAVILSQNNLSAEKSSAHTGKRGQKIRFVVE